MQDVIHENDFLEHCYSKIEKKCEWGGRENWRNRNFEELSFRISRASGVKISSGTLKRAFGKVKTNDNYQPQMATKDALVAFLGYLNWIDFKEQSKPLLQNQKRNIVKQPRTFKKKHIRKALFRITGIISLMALIYLMIGLRDNIKQTSIHVKGKHLIGKAFHTAVFEYELDKSEDNYTIDFGDSQSSALKNSENIITHYYMLPDLYHVKVLDGNRKSQVDTFVYLKTSGWEVFANELQEDEIRYFPINKYPVIHNNSLSCPPEIARASGIDTNEIYWVHYCNIKPFFLSGDDFTFISTVKNKPEIVNVRCNHIQIDIICTNGKHSIYFVKPGCSKWVKLQFSEMSYHGINNDLTAFGQDFTKWQTVKLAVVDKSIQVSYNNIIIWESRYTRNIGEIMGLRLSFTGFGEVNEVSLIDSEGTLNYHDDFMGE